MLEYGIKSITTNPTLITKAEDIIRLVDTRTNTTRAFVLPASYEGLIEKLSKEIEYKKWVEDKKKLITQKENLDDIMEDGVNSINNYLKDDI
jgi:transaldolase